ncbi:MAG TPA: alkaline phosphatase family protein [Streptosporangiaceae bacterium]|nr:alkaline phosphatase family protein [Streptosporangiaceae bacterium]
MTIEVSRRQLMASAGGMVLASFALPSALRKVIASAPPATPRGAGLTGARLASAALSEIKHVVVLMQENRSFDHYFGAMPGVRGFADPSVPKSRFYQYDAQNPDKYLLPFHTDTHSTSAQNLPSNSHSWGPQHDSWDNGKMDGFVTAHLAADGVAGQYTMAYFKRDDVPFHWALADAFTICDGYHCSMLGPTWPNRLYLMTGQVDPAGVAGGPVYSNFVPAAGYSWKTYPEMLTDAGVSWKIYQEADNYGMNVMEYFDQYQNAPVSSPLYQNAMRFYQAGQFEYDALNDRLPTVSWIIPTSFQSEHPDFMPAAGADFVASKVNAIASNPDVFAKTVFVLIYDENDGLFDHVTPPTAPAGTAGEFITVDGASDPIGLGFRVPCIIVSPWTVGGFVSHDTFDHTSVIRLIERVTGVVNPNITPWRRKTVGDFTAALGSVPNGRFPRLPGTKAELEAAENEVLQFQLPPIPGANQTFPVQPPGSKPVVSAAISTAGVI